jgi:hypothetical protein
LGPVTPEQDLTSGILSKSVGTASSILDSFSGWLLGGFAASSVLLITQYDSISRHLSPSVIRAFLFLFLGSLLLAILQKVLAALNAAHSKAAAFGRKMGKRLIGGNAPLDFEWILGRIEQASIPQLRWIVTCMLNKARKGEITAVAELHFRLVQFQGIVALAQAILAGVAILIIALNFHS